FTFVIAAGSPTSEPAKTPVPVATPLNPQPVTEPAEANQLVGPSPVQQEVSAAGRWAELTAILTLIGAIVFRNSVLPRSGWHDELLVDSADRARQLARGA